MSYYTGFNERDLKEQRMLLLARADTASDPELEFLLRRQVRSILMHARQPKAELDRVYSAATDRNRDIIAAEFRDFGRSPFQE